MRVVLFCLALLAVSISQAAGQLDTAPIGPHFPLFKFEKSFHPQNVLVAYTRLDSKCRFVEGSSDRIVDFYWLNSGVERKDAHRLIKSGIRKRLVPVKLAEPSAVAFHLKSARELGPQLQDQLQSLQIEVDAVRGTAGCEVETTASYKSGTEIKRMSVEKIQAQTKRTWLPPFHKLQSVTLVGKNLADGKPVSQAFGM